MGKEMEQNLQTKNVFLFGIKNRNNYASLNVNTSTGFLRVCILWDGLLEDCNWEERGARKQKKVIVNKEGAYMLSLLEKQKKVAS